MRCQSFCTGRVVAGLIGEGARSSRPIASLLAHFTGRFPAARAAVNTLAADPRPHIRRTAMRCVGPDTPREFALTMIEAGLVDQDDLVRHAAISYALGCNGAYGIALCLWGRDQEAIQYLSSIVQYAPSDQHYLTELIYVQDVAAGKRARPSSLADCLKELNARK